MGSTGSVRLTRLSTAVLIALGDGVQHGYAILKEIERQSGGDLSPKAGSLYAALQRLADEGVIAEAEPPDPGGDARRVHYRVTERGRRSLRAEAARMARTLAVARASGLLTGGELGGAEVPS